MFRTFSSQNDTQSPTLSHLLPTSFLRFRASVHRKEISIMLIGSQCYCESMAESIKTVIKSKKFSDVIFVLTECVENVLKSSHSNVHVDYVVFLLNTKLMLNNLIQKVEFDVSRLESVYFCGRILMVNCNGTLEDAIYHDLFYLSKKYGSLLLHGDIQNGASRLNLAQRIANAAIASLGMKTGIPIILDFPADEFPFKS